MKIGFYSCMTGMPWGGSEVLWQRAARKLQMDGHQIAVNYKWWPKPAPPLQYLQEQGAKICFREQPGSRWARRKESLLRLARRTPGPYNWLEQERPDVVLITLGYHTEPLPIASECVRLGIPYGINLQCASSFAFIHSHRLDEFRYWYQHARQVFFVSDENRAKLENNIAATLPQSEIVANPFNVDFHANPEWPSTDKEYRLAVVGRIHFQSKGQDLLVDVLRQPQWRSRNLRVRFYGQDQGNQRQLHDLIKLHGLESQLRFEGYEQNVEQIWADNHALLLPSRYEGAPLAFIEAMLCNRIAITTDIGRNRELMVDNESGFLAPAATVDSLNDALERAWAKREQWQAMGKLAGQQIRSQYPEDPIGEFAEKIVALV